MKYKKLSKKDTSKKKSFPSWLTTDEHEIELRKSRAAKESMSVKPVIQGGKALFADYYVKRKDVEEAQEYVVEIRSLNNKINYCNCPDFSKNGLGTCKHIEKVLQKIIPKRNKKLPESPFIEVFMERTPEYHPSISFSGKSSSAASFFMKQYLNPLGEFKAPVNSTVQLFLRDWQSAVDSIQHEIRISKEFVNYCEELSYQFKLQKASDHYGTSLHQANGVVDFLKYPLYDYQIEGMLHLAFNGRAMLTDEMGLGKTVQAIAAASVMHNIFKIKRVLVVSPASLKTEWEEQINKFTALSSKLLFGSRKERLETYQQSESFFLLSNYEQVLRDYDNINTYMQPDLIILDEAQRIKNWKTKTATNLKRLNSKFAFILTGTPLENKIDELYSLVDFIDPRIFGSLFRFNRKFYKFDSDGKIEAYNNLRQLHETVKPIMLRRRKGDIADQLPERIDNNYFITLTPEQKKRYAEFNYRVMILTDIAKRRPLKPEEFEELQRLLACMRMLCDTCYILDSEIKESPKVDELLKILNDIWEDEPDRKIIIFSEWVKMLELIKWQLEENGVDYCWHTGSVPQAKRRDEINRFKKDHDCKVFLSSESGGAGLNLQAASVVINMDLPWNPAKLEQRIARAWRKHQKNAVNVINLVASHTIEHKMLGTLDFKQGLADGVLDGIGDIEKFEEPNAREQFMTRLSSILDTDFQDAPPKETIDSDASNPLEQDISPADKLKQELDVKKPDTIKSCQEVIDKDTGKLKSILALTEQSADKAKDELAPLVEKTHGEAAKKQIISLDENTMKLLQQLQASGLITINTDNLKPVYQNENKTPPAPSDREVRLKLAKPILKQAEHKLKMATVLRESSFIEESHQPATDAVLIAAKVLMIFISKRTPDKEPENFDVKLISTIRKELDFDKNKLMFLNLTANGLLDDDQDIVKDAEDFVTSISQFITECQLTA